MSVESRSAHITQFNSICHLQYFASMVLLVSGLFLVFHECCEFYLHFGRILAGMVHGIVYTTILQHSSDNSSPHFRRCIILFVSCVLSLPLMIVALTIRPYVYLHDNAEIDVRTHIAIGAVTLLFAILALILMPCTRNSIVFQLSSNRDLQALECMYEIRRESRHSIRTDFNELKLMVAQDCYDGGHLLRDGNIRPLCWILAARVLCALMANNICLTISTMDVWTGIVDRYGNYTFDDASFPYEYTEIPLVIVLAAKLIVGLLVLLALDKFSCHTNPPFCFYISAFLLSTLNLMISIVMAIDFSIASTDSMTFSYVLMWTLNVINVLFVCIAFGIDTFGYTEIERRDSLSPNGHGPLRSYRSLKQLFTSFSFYLH